MRKIALFISLFLLSAATVAASPQAQLAISDSADLLSADTVDNVFVLTHEGGESIVFSQMKVIVKTSSELLGTVTFTSDGCAVPSSNSHLTATVSPNAGDNGMFDPGEQITFTEIPGYTVNPGVLNVEVVDTLSGQPILSGQVQVDAVAGVAAGGGGGGGTNPLLSLALDRVEYLPGESVVVHGYLTDGAGNPIASAYVTISHNLPGLQTGQGVATDGNGKFVFTLNIPESCPPGDYTVTATYDGAVTSASFRVISRQITEDDFTVTWTLTPDKTCYNQGDKVTLHYTIKPASDEAARKAGGKTFRFGTTLNNPAISAVVHYKNGAGVGYENSGEGWGKNHLDLKVAEWDYGLEKIDVEVTGVVPSESGTAGYTVLSPYIEGYPGVLSPVIIDVCSGIPTVTPIETVTPTPAPISGKVVQFVVTEGVTDSGGHLYIEGLPSTVKVGETYTVMLTFSFEWSDAENTVFDVDGIYAGFVSDKNLIDYASGKAVLISEATQPRHLDPDWVGFDFIAVNKKVKIGDSIKVIAHITPQRTTQSGRAYLMFKLVGSGTGGIPESTGVVNSQLIFPIQPVTVSVFSSPTPTPAPNPPAKLERLKLSIEPKYVEAKLGDTVNYTITLNWYPPEWRGDVVFRVMASSAGFEKEIFTSTAKPTTNPPVTRSIQVPIGNLPPLTYKVKVVVEANSLKTSDETTLKVRPSTPGFEAVVAILAGAAALALRRLR